MSDPQKWDRIHADAGTEPPAAAVVLSQNLHLLPRTGTALDLACGRGGNALLLAAAGLDTHAWDFSATALARLERHAADAGVQVNTEHRDVLAAPPAPGTFDVIVVTHYLERDLAPRLAAALRPGGLLYYQTFLRAAVDGSGPSNPAYRLAENELLHLFAGLQLLVYREEGLIGDVLRGWRNEAMLVGRKPA